MRRGGEREKAYRRCWRGRQSALCSDNLDPGAGRINYKSVALCSHHSETGRLGDGKTEVKSDNTGDTTKTNEQTPHGVNMVKNGRVIV